jgi:hypothetical protein
MKKTLIGSGMAGREKHSLKASLETDSLRRLIARLRARPRTDAGARQGTTAAYQCRRDESPRCRDIDPLTEASSNAARHRQNAHGSNHIASRRTSLRWLRYGLQLDRTLVYLPLLAVAGMTAVGDWVDSSVFTYARVTYRSFHTAPISAESWPRILGVAVAVCTIVEVEKWMRYGCGRNAPLVPE